MRKFGRTFELKIATGPSWKEGEVITIKPPLRVDFDIVRNNSTSANKASFKIYNLGRRTRKILEDLKPGKWHGIQFLAGYGDAPPLVFYGDFHKAPTSHAYPNYITQIDALDGNFATSNSAIEKQLSYSMPLTHVQLFRDLIKLLLPLDPEQIPYIGAFPDQFKLPLSFPGGGNVWEEIKRYTADKCFIDNGRFIALQPDEWIGKNGNQYYEDGRKKEAKAGTVFEISSHTGLTRTPTKDGENYVADMIFEPRLSVGSYVALRSATDPTLNIGWIVRGIKHSGDVTDKGEKWTTVATLYPTEEIKLGESEESDENKEPDIKEKSSSEIDLKALLDSWKKDVFFNLHCHLLGTIQAFNSKTQTATITINHLASIDGTKTGEYGILKGVPVFMPAGGDATLSMPVKKGDTCLVLFSDRDITEWKINDDLNAKPDIPRAHNYNDALAIVGFRSPGKKGDPDKEEDDQKPRDAELRHAGAVIAASADSLVSIRNENEKTSLHALLTSLVECLKKFQVNINTGVVMPGIVDELNNSIQKGQLDKLLK